MKIKTRLYSLIIMLLCIANFGYAQDLAVVTGSKSPDVNMLHNWHATAHEVVAKDNNKEKKVLVVAHRGDWRNYPENSLAAIQSCIDIGVDIVEIDVAKTKDGHLILMHDQTLNRTTNGLGKVSDFTLKQIKDLNLKDASGKVLPDYTVPTLEEAMRLVKGKIRVNLDKTSHFINDVYTILEKTNTVDHAIVKSSMSQKELAAKFGNDFTKIEFMPIIHISNTTTMESIGSLLDAQYPMYEIIFSKENKKLLLEIKDRLKDTPSRIWINSLWSSLCAGYTDDKACKDPDGAWGYLINTLGASVIQTDRPVELRKYLEEKNR